MTDRALPPVIVLLSDGCPTDNYKDSLNKLMHLPWGKKAVKIAISIGQDADNDVLTDFTGNKELVLQANNADSLTKMIKWASTAASVISAPASRVAPVDSSSITDALLAQDSIGATSGVAPLVLDMHNIPNPDDVGEGDVW